MSSEGKKRFKTQETGARPEFVAAYEALEPKVRSAFDYLRDNLMKQCPQAGHGYTDTPSLRLDYGTGKRPVNFCVITPEKNRIKIGLELGDYQRPAALTPEWTDITHSGSKKTWLRRFLPDFNQEELDNTVAVIKDIYDQKVDAAR